MEWINDGLMTMFFFVIELESSVKFWSENSPHGDRLRCLWPPRWVDQSFRRYSMRDSTREWRVARAEASRWRRTLPSR